MKQIGRILAMMVMLAAGSLRGQGCQESDFFWRFPGKTPTFIALLTDNYEHLSSKTWSLYAKGFPVQNDRSFNEQQAFHFLQAGNPAEASKSLAAQVADIEADTISDSIPRAYGALELAGIAALAQEKLDQAVRLLSLAVAQAGDGYRCHAHMQLLLARYVQQYGIQTPQHAHFNSGFYNYLQDSLHWKAGAPDADGYVLALNSVVQWYRLDPTHSALYLELLGDLLSKEPTPFNANYLSSLAYMRAGMYAGGAQQQAYERKALFALEAPRQSEQRFNLYRFTQLKKALQEDVDSAAVRQARFDVQDAASDAYARLQDKSTDDPISVGFLPTDLGRLPAILAKSKSQIEAHNAEVKRYAGDVDLKKEVKKDNRFNTFALFLIAIIIGAAIFFWRKLRAASKM